MIGAREIRDEGLDATDQSLDLVRLGADARGQLLVLGFCRGEVGAEGVFE